MRLESAKATRAEAHVAHNEYVNLDSRAIEAGHLVEQVDGALSTARAKRNRFEAAELGDRVERIRSLDGEFPAGEPIGLSIASSNTWTLDDH